MTTVNRVRAALLDILENPDVAAEDRTRAAAHLMELERTPWQEPEPMELVTAKFTREQMACLSHWVTMIVGYHNLMHDRASGIMPHRDLSPTRHALQAAGDRVRAVFGVEDKL